MLPATALETASSGNSYVSSVSSSSPSSSSSELSAAYSYSDEDACGGIVFGHKSTSPRKAKSRSPRRGGWGAKAKAHSPRRKKPRPMPHARMKGWKASKSKTAIAMRRVPERERVRRSSSFESEKQLTVYKPSNQLGVQQPHLLNVGAQAFSVVSGAAGAHMPMLQPVLFIQMQLCTHNTMKHFLQRRMHLKLCPSSEELAEQDRTEERYVAVTATAKASELVVLQFSMSIVPCG